MQIHNLKFSHWILEDSSIILSPTCAMGSGQESFESDGEQTIA
jgi:hypothetical protein